MDALSAMLMPGTYPHPVSGLRHLETHISHIFLTGELAYKIKKPLSNPFLDYSTLELRRKYCEAELQLNRRFAPDIYLGLVALARDQQGWNLEGRGEIVEYAVKMREFTQDSLLLSLVRRGGLTEEIIRSLGAELGRIHLEAPQLTNLSLPYGSLSSVSRESGDNFLALSQAAGQIDQTNLQQLASAVETMLDRLSETLERRRVKGFVRECHGDLHLGNLIWFEGKAQLFDGIEFNDSFRWIDVMSDLGFVLMDLEEHRRPDLANLLLNVYLEQTGDYAGLAVLRFYKIYRALVRAKVAAIRAGQQPTGDSEKNWSEVREYLAYAESGLMTRPPQLLVTHGLSGSGKTYQTESLLSVPGVIRIRSDVERKRLAGIGITTRGGSRPEQGLYSAEKVQGVYEYLVETARTILAAGWSVIVDATFLAEANRQQFRELARESGVLFGILHFEATPEVLEARVAERTRAGHDASDAGVEVLHRQLEHYQPLAAHEQDECRSLDDLRKSLSMD